MSESIKACKDYFEGLAWEHIIWSDSCENVLSIQRRIFRASCLNEKHKVWFLQRLLLKNPHAKLLAINVVGSVIGKWISGPVTSTLSFKERILLAKNLTLEGKMGFLDSSGFSEDSIREKILVTTFNKAKEVLCSLVLDPEWKAKLEKRFYTFRSRSDVSRILHGVVRQLRHMGNLYACSLDLGKSFALVKSGDFLDSLDTFPVIERQMRLWIRNGAFCNYRTVSELGVTSSSLEHPISSLLIDVGLSYLQSCLVVVTSSVILLSYFDCFLLMGKEEVLVTEVLKNLLSKFQALGIVLQDNQCKVHSSNQGFVFLGFQVITLYSHKKFKVSVRPSKSSVVGLLAKTRSVIQSSKARTSHELVHKLTLILLNWATYFQYCHCKETFSKVDSCLYQQLRAWVFRRDSRHGRSYIKQEYFPEGKIYSFQGKLHASSWVLNGVKDPASQKGSSRERLMNFLPKLSWIASKRSVLLGSKEQL